MKLSDLAKEDNYMDLSSAYGVFVDDFIVDIPYHFKEIGLVAEKDDSGSLSEDLIDVALALRTNGVEVLLEIPFGFDMPARDIAIICSNAELSISVLPPIIGDDESYEKYAETLCEYTSIWLAQSNAQKMLYPSISYFQYMINEVMGYLTPEISTDEYIINNFVNPVPVKDMDKIKDKLRETIYQSTGGVKGFETFAHSLGITLSNDLTEKAS